MYSSVRLRETENVLERTSLLFWRYCTFVNFQ